MARTVFVSTYLNSRPRQKNHLSTVKHHQPFLSFPKQTHQNTHLSFPSSYSQSPSSSSSSKLQPPFQKGRFLTKEELEKLDFLTNYSYHQELESGFLWVRLMREEELDITVSFLSESFAESMMMTKGYVKFLEFLVKNYLIERREVMPHNATLLGVYRGNGEEDFKLAGTVELTFNRKGANANPPTPTPPKNSPYICNMAVLKSLRRRGIGWHLLKAVEELITQMSSSRDIYLHCRIMDDGPFNMYKKAGYTIVNTDSILTLLTLQRRRHLMQKDLPVPENPTAVDIPSEELSLSPVLHK